MPTGRIDRDAWAEEVANLITQFDPGPKPPGNKSAFARRIGLTTRSIDRWLGREVAVSLDSVRAVADRLGIGQQEQIELLTRIGYFTGRSPAAPTIPDPREDPVIRRILEDPIWTDENERRMLVQHQLDRIERETQQRLADYLWYREQRVKGNAS